MRIKTRYVVAWLVAGMSAVVVDLSTRDDVTRAGLWAGLRMLGQAL